MPIRYALPPDADAMAEITCAAFAEFEDFDVTRAQSAANWRRNLLGEAAERPRPHRTRVAEPADGTIIGLVMAGPADPELGHDAEIYALAVHPGHQALTNAPAASTPPSAESWPATHPPDEVFYSWPKLTTLL